MEGDQIMGTGVTKKLIHFELLILLPLSSMSWFIGAGPTPDLQMLFEE